MTVDLRNLETVRKNGRKLMLYQIIKNSELDNMTDYRPISLAV